MLSSRQYADSRVASTGDEQRQLGVSAAAHLPPSPPHTSRWIRAREWLGCIRRQFLRRLAATGG